MKELDNQVVAAKFDNKNTSIQFAETFAETQLIFLLLSFSNNLLNIALIFCVTSFHNNLVNPYKIGCFRAIGGK